MMIKAVIVVDSEGNYLLHGTNSEDAKEMFKKVSQLWHFDPSKETVHFVEFELNIDAPVLG